MELWGGAQGGQEPILGGRRRRVAAAVAPCALPRRASLGGEWGIRRRPSVCSGRIPYRKAQGSIPFPSLPNGGIPPQVLSEGPSWCPDEGGLSEG